MNITSIIKDSFQEYEGQQSLVLFCSGCNFNCKGCYNYEEVTSEKNIGKAIEVIDKNLTPMHDAVVFLGGEPCIWGKTFIESLKYAKTKNIKTKLFTNGSFPEVVFDACNSGVDSISVDIKSCIDITYATGVNISDFQYLSNIATCYHYACQYDVVFELRTTAFEWVDVEYVKEFVKNHFPNTNHIIQSPFEAPK